MKGAAETRGAPALSRRQSLQKAAKAIEAATGSEEAYLEAEILLCHALRIDRVELYRSLDRPLGPADAGDFEALVARRCEHEPTAYLTGRREFFGLDFEVTPAALIPRPETETLVDAVITFAEKQRARPLTIADIGVGCGTIAVALARTLPSARMIAIDASPGALSLARRNARRQGVADRIDFRGGHLLSPLTEPVDVIATNLPYVRTADWESLPPEIRDWEPRAALDGGKDGLRVIESLLRQAHAYLSPGGALFAEIGDDQASAVAAIVRQAFPGAEIAVKKDLAGHDRVVVIRTAR
jgi:release factor glutamine methyltransferase